MLFDIDGLEDYLPQASFLSTLLGYMDTQKHTYTEFDTETNFYTGGITSDLDIYCCNRDSDDYRLKFEVRTKVLRNHLKEALDLMAEMMFETLFTDEKHLREVVAEGRSRLKVRLLTSGHQAAASRATSCFSKSSWLNDHYLGIGYYEYLVQLDEHFEEEKERLAAGCRALLAKAFRREGLLVSITGADAEYAELEKELPAFLGRLASFEESSTGDEEGALSKMLRVARHLLNYDYLWNEVRVKGGAYGVACQFQREGDGYFTSYRDPNLSSTIDVYEGAADYLENYSADEREITKTIIGTISGMDVPLTPNMNGSRSLTGYLSGITEEELQEERDQVLNCSLEDIRSLAPVMRAVADSSNLCVIGNERHLTDEKELFAVLKPLS